MGQYKELITDEELIFDENMECWNRPDKHIEEIRNRQDELLKEVGINE